MYRKVCRRCISMVLVLMTALGMFGYKGSESHAQLPLTKTVSITEERVGDIPLSSFAATKSFNDGVYSGTLTRGTRTVSTRQTITQDQLWVSAGSYPIDLETPSVARTPNSITISYRDSASGQTVTGTGSPTNSPYWYGATENKDFFVVSDGQYDPDKHHYLGYLSDSRSSYYIGETFSFNTSPRKPNDPYHEYAGADGKGWELVECRWGQDASGKWLTNADPPEDGESAAWRSYLINRYGDAKFRTDGGNAYRFRKPVYLRYKKNLPQRKVARNYRASIALKKTTVTYTGTVKLIDTTPPVITLTPKNVDWTNKDVTYTIKVTDDISGVAEVQQRWRKSDGTWSHTGSTWDVVKLNTNGEYTSTFSGQGARELEVWAKDKVGNTTTPNNVKGMYRIDKTAPGVTANPINRGWSNANASIKITIKDTVSGVAEVSGIKDVWAIVNQNSKAPSSTDPSWGNGKGPIGSLDQTFSKDGENYIHIWANDNTNPRNATIITFGPYRVDKTAPDVTADPIDRAWGNTDASTRITIGDKGGSGMQDVWVITDRNPDTPDDNDKRWSKRSNTSSFTQTFSGEGNNYIHVWARDNAGNVTKKDFGPYKVDKTKADHKSHSLTGVQYVVGNDYWVQANTLVKYRDKGYDALSGIRYHYARLFNNEQNIDVRAGHHWDNANANHIDAWRTNENVKIAAAKRIMDSKGEREVEWDIVPGDADYNYDIHYYYTDFAGNESDDGASSGYGDTGMRLRVDGTAPGIFYWAGNDKGYFEECDWTDEEVVVKVIALDGPQGSGTKKVRVAWSKSEERPSDGWSDYVEADGVIARQHETGIWYLHAEAEDNVGNKNYSSTGPYRIDTTTPDIGFELDGGDYICDYDNSIKVKLNTTYSGFVETKFWLAKSADEPKANRFLDVEERSLNYATGKTESGRQDEQIVELHLHDRGDEMILGNYDGRNGGYNGGWDALREGSWYLHIEAKDRTGRIFKEVSPMISIAKVKNLRITSVQDEHWHEYFKRGPKGGTVAAFGGIGPKDFGIYETEKGHHIGLGHWVEVKIDSYGFDGPNDSIDMDVLYHAMTNKSEIYKDVELYLKQKNGLYKKVEETDRMDEFRNITLTADEHRGEYEHYYDVYKNKPRNSDYVFDGTQERFNTWTYKFHVPATARFVENGVPIDLVKKNHFNHMVLSTFDVMGNKHTSEYGDQTLDYTLKEDGWAKDMRGPLDPPNEYGRNRASGQDLIGKGKNHGEFVWFSLYRTFMDRVKFKRTW